jgi:L-aminopeptidase/D-esterase-like protein
LLHPSNLVQEVHGIMLAGGSAWGWTQPQGPCAGWKSKARA